MLVEYTYLCTAEEFVKSCFNLFTPFKFCMDKRRGGGEGGESGRERERDKREKKGVYRMRVQGREER